MLEIHGAEASDMGHFGLRHPIDLKFPGVFPHGDVRDGFHVNRNSTPGFLLERGSSDGNYKNMSKSGLQETRNEQAGGEGLSMRRTLMAVSDQRDRPQKREANPLLLQD